MRKANKRYFSGSCVPVGTSRGKFLTSKFPSEITKAMRNLRKRESSSFSVPGLKEFEEGYELVGLPLVVGIDEFYNEKGRDYVIGVISRFKDYRQGISHIYAHKRALRYKENNFNK